MKEEAADSWKEVDGCRKKEKNRVRERVKGWNGEGKKEQGEKEMIAKAGEGQREKERYKGSQWSRGRGGVRD